MVELLFAIVGAATLVVIAAILLMGTILTLYVRLHDGRWWWEAEWHG